MMISCLFISYNRSNLLKLAVTSLRRAMAESPIPCEFAVSDDGSSVDHLAVLHCLNFDVLALSERNFGLGHNSNKGIAACRMPYILQVQDDWLFSGDCSDVQAAIDILREDAEVGIVQLTRVQSDLPVVQRRTRCGAQYQVYANDRLPWIRRSGLRPYSDHPHLKRREFIESLGSYAEGVGMAATELDFQKRVANQTRWRVAQIVPPVFEYLGLDCSLNPGSSSSSAVRLASRVPVGKYLLGHLRKAKHWADHAAARLVHNLTR